MKRGNIVKIDWVGYEESISRTIEEQIKIFLKMGMDSDHPWITGMVVRSQDLLKHRGNTAEVMWSRDMSSYINLKFSDGFEFGCERKFVYI